MKSLRTPLLLVVLVSFFLPSVKAQGAPFDFCSLSLSKTLPWLENLPAVLRAREAIGNFAFNRIVTLSDGMLDSVYARLHAESIRQRILNPNASIKEIAQAVDASALRDSLGTLSEWLEERFETIEGDRALWKAQSNQRALDQALPILIEMEGILATPAGTPVQLNLWQVWTYFKLYSHLLSDYRRKDFSTEEVLPRAFPYEFMIPRVGSLSAMQISRAAVVGVHFREHVAPSTQVIADNQIYSAEAFPGHDDLHHSDYVRLGERAIQMATEIGRSLRYLRVLGVQRSLWNRYQTWVSAQPSEEGPVYYAAWFDMFRDDGRRPLPREGRKMGVGALIPEHLFELSDAQINRGQEASWSEEFPVWVNDQLQAFSAQVKRAFPTLASSLERFELKTNVYLTTDPLLSLSLFHLGFWSDKLVRRLNVAEDLGAEFPTDPRIIAKDPKTKKYLELERILSKLRVWWILQGFRP